MSDLRSDGCPFCNIDESRIIEAAREAYAVLDAYPVSQGHTLICTRRHIESVFELSMSEITEIIALVQSAKHRLDREYRPTGYNVGVNVGRDAGQTVMHVHVHVIPRYPGDLADPTGGVRNIFPGKGRYG